MASTAASRRISRRVAVIGGGSAGLSTARYLLRAGHQPVVLESGSGLGGVWAEDPTNTVVYQNLQTNLPTYVMQSPDFDFPTRLSSSYVTARELGRYIEMYADAFGITSTVQRNAHVTSVVPLSDEVDAECWRVSWTKGGDPFSDEFDAVAVATGHYNKPYRPELPGQAEWLRASAARRIVHSIDYNCPDEFRAGSVMVVGGRSSGVDIARELRGTASWVYVLEKGCTEPVAHEGESCAHIPLGTSLHADGRLRAPSGGAIVPGPPVDTVILATGYEYDFPFLDEEELGLSFRGQRHVTPLYEHLMHAQQPTLGFIGIPLSVPCPIPFFEIQAAYLGEHWATPQGLTAEAERCDWVPKRLASIEPRWQDTHLMGAPGGKTSSDSAWAYMRRLLELSQLSSDVTDTWLSKMDTVEAVYNDRSSRRPTMPWDDDAYRRCEYRVDWATGEWSVEEPALEHSG